MSDGKKAEYLACYKTEKLKRQEEKTIQATFSTSNWLEDLDEI